MVRLCGDWCSTAHLSSRSWSPEDAQMQCNTDEYPSVPKISKHFSAPKVVSGACALLHQPCLTSLAHVLRGLFSRGHATHACGRACWPGRRALASSFAADGGKKRHTSQDRTNVYTRNDSTHTHTYIPKCLFHLSKTTLPSPSSRLSSRLDLTLMGEYLCLAQREDFGKWEDFCPTRSHRSK